MAHIFISYSKKDIDFARQLKALLETSGFVVWIDETALVPHERWWERIENSIDTCAAFIILMSPNSKASDWVEREILHAERIAKPIFPILVSGAYWSRLANIQHENMTAGVPSALPARMETGLRTYIPANAPTTVPPPLPGALLPASDQAPTSKVAPITTPRFSLPMLVGGVAAVAVIAILLGMASGIFNPQVTLTATLVPTTPITATSAIALVATEKPSNTDVPTILAATATPRPTDTPVPPTPMPNAAEREATLQALMLSIQDEQAGTRAAQASATADSLTATAESWTDTPMLTWTPTTDDRATAVAHLTATEIQAMGNQTGTAVMYLTATQQQAEANQTAAVILTNNAQFAQQNQTATSESGTDTPTMTVTPSSTPTVTHDPLQLASTPIARNSDWTPVTQDFGGVTMVLVPVGRFEMGSTSAQIDAGFAMCQQSVDNSATCDRNWYEDELTLLQWNIQTIAPFWLDETEVTRARYVDCVEAMQCEETPASSFSTTNEQPINNVTWFQARAYCIWRGGRLPTEAEWEYAARGADELIFPWGNGFDGTRANHCDVNCGESSWAADYNFVSEENNDGYALTSPVGSYPLGASWVGALDMSGNVWEWTSSLYEPYPYDNQDGREVFDNRTNNRTLRGGSFFNASDALRVAGRDDWSPISGGYTIGFRCARSQ